MPGLSVPAQSHPLYRQREPRTRRRLIGRTRERRHRRQPDAPGRDPGLATTAQSRHEAGVDRDAGKAIYRRVAVDDIEKLLLAGEAAQRCWDVIHGCNSAAPSALLI